MIRPSIDNIYTVRVLVHLLVQHNTVIITVVKTARRQDFPPKYKKDIINIYRYKYAIPLYIFESTVQRTVQVRSGFVVSPHQEY